MSTLESYSCASGLLLDVSAFVRLESEASAPGAFAIGLEFRLVTIVLGGTAALHAYLVWGAVFFLIKKSASRSHFL
jgi:hypothetical protein